VPGTIPEHAHVGVDLGTEYRISNLETTAQKRAMELDALKLRFAEYVTRVDAFSQELWSLQVGIRNLRAMIEQHEWRSHDAIPRENEVKEEYLGPIDDG
jgi:hypothetical protein